MASSWTTTTLNSEADVYEAFSRFHKKQWLHRGQSEAYGTLVPSIDRGRKLAALARKDKLLRERGSIELFRTTVRFFAPGEKEALDDDFTTLMVLRHYGVPTRLLDWSRSPYVAAHFAVSGNDGKDGELWSFEHDYYAEIGKEQWRKWKTTTTDGSGDPEKFAAALTAFTLDEPKEDWIVAGFYPRGFPRQDAQRGAYTMTARFGHDHADKLGTLMVEPSTRHRHVISANLKPILKQILRQKYGTWQGTIFPDSAGAAAETAAFAFK
jgi:hypothetical protein